MLDTQPDQSGDEGRFDSQEPGSSRALVVRAEPVRWQRSRAAARAPSPDPIFVAQLIANAELFSQSHNVPGENAADAMSAYRARQHRSFGSGRLTLRMI